MTFHSAVPIPYLPIFGDHDEEFDKKAASRYDVMVNTGKASSACAVCKQRRIRCDLAKPQCSQCVKSGWVCPGSRSETDLTFKDQTDAIVKNVIRGLTNKEANPVASSSGLLARPAPVRTLSPSTLDQGIAFFLHHYVLEKTDANLSALSIGVHEYLPKLMFNDEADGPLRMIVAAAGLAALSNTRNSRAMRTESYQMYNLVIRQIKSVLDDPVESQKDTTLAAIMLMGSFEWIASGDQQSLRTFGSHAMAAGGGIEFRGNVQFQGEIPLKLFLDLCPVLLMVCHQKQVRVPYDMEKWFTWVRSLQRAEDLPFNHLMKLSSQLATLRVDVNCETISPSSALERFVSMEEQFIRWRRSLPPSWYYSAHRFPDLEGVSPYLWQLRYDAYPDYRIVCAWNHWRSARLLLHEAIIIFTLAQDLEDRSNLEVSDAVIAEMVDEICFSVPYLLGQSRESIYAEASRTGKQPQTESTPTPGGYLLIWPLFLAGMSRSKDKQRRQWIAGILKMIGVNMGLRVATSVSRMIGVFSGTLVDGKNWWLGEFDA